MTTIRSEPDVAPALMDVDAVASLLSCSPVHVRRLADSGKMPRPVKLGSLVRWRREAIQKWLADGCPSCKEGRR